MIKKRYYSLDFVKIIATIFIILHHYQIYTKSTFLNGINFNGGFFDFTYLVELFFILSGFFMHKYIDRIKDGVRFTDFFIPKYIRFITPQTISCIVFALLDVWYEKLYSGVFFDRKPDVFGVIVSSLGFSTGWGLPNSKMNGTIWYISVLLVCYVVFYCAILFSKKMDCSVYWVFVFLIFLSFSVYSKSISVLFFTASTARGMYSFFFGVILARIMKDRNPNVKACILSLLSIISFMILLYFWHDTYMKSGKNYLYTFILYPCIIVFMQSSVISKIFKIKLIGEISKVSFEAYIWHFPLILLLIDLNKFLEFNISLNNRLIMYIIVILSFMLGTVMYYLVEIPASNIINKTIRKYMCNN